MTVQLFLYGRLHGIEDFLLSPPAVEGQESAGDEALVAGRSHWVALLAEVLPRALLAELGLARILLGFSGGGRFLIVLPSEAQQQAEALLAAAAAGIRLLSEGKLRLVWAFTENLGDWSLVRKRLAEQLWVDESRIGPQEWCEGFFDPCAPEAARQFHSYFRDRLAAKVFEASTAGWSVERPAEILIGEGKYQWPLVVGEDAILMARHVALSDDSRAPASLEDLARRASGRPYWGVLRGDVDNFAVLLRRQATIEEYLQVSVMFRQFFVGELEMLCSMPEFWRKVTILYTGGDDFAVYGSWDALLTLARELQRVFHRFCEANLQQQPGPEGKTITMSLALAEELATPFAFVYEEAARNLQAAKSAGKDCIHAFGRTLEWKQFAQAAELKDSMMQLVEEFHCSTQFLSELSSFYHDRLPARAHGQPRQDRPWRYHRRFYVAAGGSRDREFMKLRTRLVTDLIGRSPTQVRLRPAGRVAVEWARLLIEA